MSAVHFLLLNFKVYQLVVFMAHQMACTVLLTNKTANIHQIDRYNVYDQCMARPESSRAFHNRLAFHMDKQQFCPADGLLICFVGQLGPELALPNGLVAEPFYQIANKKPNPVTKRCDHLRKRLERANGCGKEEGKCEWKAPINNASTGTWHGILLKTTDSDEHVLVQLSSSQQNFTFERSKLGDGEDDGWFFLKLVSAVNGGQSFFSREQEFLRSTLE